MEQLRNLSPEPTVKLKTILDTANYGGSAEPYLKDYTLMNRAANSEAIVDVATGRLHGRPTYKELIGSSRLQLKYDANNFVSPEMLISGPNMTNN